MPNHTSDPSRRPITAEDLFRFRLAADPQLSPNGAQVAYVLQWTDLEQNKYFSNLRLVRADGVGDRPFTQGKQRECSPRWSPDGTRLAFVSDRSERSQIWCIPVDGGEAVALTELEEGAIGDLQWSPDGTRLAFTFRAKPAWARKDAQVEREKQHRCPPPMVIRHLRYREEGAGYIGEERRHLYVLDLASRKLTQLTNGRWDELYPCWSPDGSRLAFVTNRSADPDRTPQLDDLYVIDATGENEQRVEAPAGPKHHLTWSPDGSTFAYYGHTDTRDAWSGCDPHLWTLPATGGAGKDLSAVLDRPAGNCTLADLRPGVEGWTGPVWSPNSRAIHALVSDRGAVHVYRFALDGGAPVNLTPGLDAEVSSLSVDAKGERITALVGDPVHPGEVHVSSLDRPALNLRAITDSNRELLNELVLAAPEEIEAPSEAGFVHGWILHPTQRPEGGRSPLILYIHGGPHTQYGWAMMHELQLLAAQGFSVLYTNPRGSRGYGEAHTSAIRGDWGGPDYR
ncbi:MAG: S9 family peptidase, partial [Actinomycetota bacterium]